MKGLPAAGVDAMKLGMPCTDPMGDGQMIQAAVPRALEGGMTVGGVLAMVRVSGRGPVDPHRPYGLRQPDLLLRGRPFPKDATKARIDGLIVVDLPTEDNDEHCAPAQTAGLTFIHLATPATDDKRLPKVLQDAFDFVSYVSSTGITGAAAAQAGDVAPEVARIKRPTYLPVVVG